MTTILIGDGISPHLGILSTKLKNSAIDQFRERGVEVGAYVPWIAAGSNIDFEFPSGLLDKRDESKRGKLVNDADYVDMTRIYVERRLTSMQHHDGLLPGKREDWIPVRLTNPSAISAVDEGVEVLAGAAPTLAMLYKELVEMVLPLNNKHRGYSNVYMRGAIFRGIPDHWNRYDVAIDLAHELGHHSLYTWQSVDAILTSPEDAPILSAVRKTNRPAIQSFHGAVALSFMLYTTQTWEHDEVSTEVKKRHGSIYAGGTLEAALDDALERLNEHCTFTPVGQKMMDEMASLL